jgi:hypothetical protein
MADRTIPCYETRPVLAGAYPRFIAASLLTHTINLTTGRPLCDRVRADSIADSGANDPGEGDLPPTCKTCRRRDRRFATPEARHAE